MSLGPWNRAFSLALCAVLVGCGQWTERREQELRVLEGNRLTGGAGVAQVKVPLTSADKTMLLQVKPLAGFRSYVTEVRDAENNVLYDFADDVQRSRQRTGAAYPSDFTLFNWPVAGDDPLLSGEEVTVRVAAVDKEGELNSNVKLEIDCLMKADTDWDSGELYVNLIYAGETAEDEEIKTAVTGAVEIWREIFDDAGVILSVEGKTWAEGSLPKPGTGAPGEFLAISSDTFIRTLNVVIVPTIYESEDLLGAAGGIPGALTATDRSAIVISAAANAGPDLDYSETEVRLLGETMSHEAGHYLGLFHVVEGTYDTWDALSDTEECDDERVCIDELGTNVMFPYPVCDEQECEIQDTFTEAQKEVLQRYAGVW